MDKGVGEGAENNGFASFSTRLESRTSALQLPPLYSLLHFSHIELPRVSSLPLSTSSNSIFERLLSSLPARCRYCSGSIFLFRGRWRHFFPLLLFSLARSFLSSPSYLPLSHSLYLFPLSKWLFLEQLLGCSPTARWATSVGVPPIPIA